MLDVRRIGMDTLLENKKKLILELLDNLDELRSRATPLPWYVELHEGWDPYSICHDGKDVVKAVSYNQADAEYIAGACSAVPALTDFIREYLKHESKL